MNRIHAQTRLIVAVAAITLTPIAACSAEKDETKTTAPQTGAAQNLPWLDQVAPYMERVAAAGFHGSIVVADENGAILFEDAYGYADLENKSPFTLETAVNIGSTRKAYIAAVIMSLVDDGVLTVEALISRYLPDVPPDKGEITLHQLMTHTSGLPDDFGGPMDRIERDDLMRRILESELRFEPGTDYSYSDMGYALLQVVAERVSGVPFRDLVRDRIIRPLGLSSTGYLDAPAWRFNGGDIRVAKSYNNGAEDMMSAMYRPRTGWSPLGAGLILSTPRDAVAWMRGLREGRVVSAASVERIFSPHHEMIEDTLWYGYGWHVIDNEARGHAYGHGGASISQSFYIQYLKDDGLYIAAASNRIDIERNDNNGDGDTNDPGEISETIYAGQVAGGLARAIHQRDFTVLPRFMQDSSAGAQ